MNDRWRTKFAWSHSRQNTFDGCRKQYYYNYIAPWGPKSELTDRLWALKKLTSLIFYKGGLVHDVVAAQLSAEKIGSGMDQERALVLVDRLVGETAKKRSLAAVFVEVANGGQIAPEDFETIRLEARLQIENFFQKVWPNYRGMTITSVEQFERFQLDGFPVTVKLDLAMDSFDGLSFILDWKTGKVRPEEAEESLQPTTYALSRVKQGVPLGSIVPELVYLKTGEVFSAPRSQDDLDAITAKIIAGSKEMLAVKSESDFPADPRPWRCRNCNFATVCPEGGQFIGKQ